LPSEPDPYQHCRQMEIAGQLQQRAAEGMITTFPVAEGFLLLRIGALRLLGRMACLLPGGLNGGLSPEHIGVMLK
jgi:hypothetical protein